MGIWIIIIIIIVNKNADIYHHSTCLTSLGNILDASISCLCTQYFMFNFPTLFLLLFMQNAEDAEVASRSPNSPDSLPLVECFEMVSQINWEDDIIWSLEDVKPDLQAQARAGWIPTQTTRTAHAYALQQEQLLQQLGTYSKKLITECRDNGVGCRDGAVVRALASHQCGPGSLPRLSVVCGLSLLVLYSAPRGFSPGTPVFPSP